jgi:hypothetical protein
VIVTPNLEVPVKLSLDQFDRLKHVLGDVDLSDADEPAASRINKVTREDAAVTAHVEWGRIVYDRDEIVAAMVDTLHPMIVDDAGAELGIGSMVSDGSGGDGEVVKILEPDESHWKVGVQWPEYDEPELHSALPVDMSEAWLVCNAVTVSKP